MAYPPVPTLTIAQTPPILSYSGVHDPATDGTLVSPAVVQGGTISASGYNAQSAQSDVGNRIGGGIWGLVPGSAGTDLNLSIGAGLTLNISEGLAAIDGVRYYAGGAVVLTDAIARVYLWLSQAGAIVQVNNSLTPPAGAHVFLGSAVTAGGVITSVDFSGVVYLQGTNAFRFNSSSGTPSDTPPANVSFHQRQEGDGSLWEWDGADWWEISVGGAGGPVAVADGGTGATTAADARVNLGVGQLGVLSVAPANGTNTVSATDSQNSVVILTGGTASAEYSLEFTTAGSPTVRAGHVWTIINKTSFGVIIRRSGSGLASCFLGQGSANDQRGVFCFESSEVRRVSKDDPSYISRVITATLTATQGQVEADFLVTGAQTGVQLLALPAVAGLEGQVVAHQADIANYPLVVEANGETEPGASMTLLPGLVWQVVQDAAGRYWPIGRQERVVVVNLGLDANYTLDPSEALAKTIVITDTGVVLTLPRDVIWDVQQSAAGYEWRCCNDTLQSLTFKTSGGAGITIAAGMCATIWIDAGLDMRRGSPDV